MRNKKGGVEELDEGSGSAGMKSNENNLQPKHLKNENSKSWDDIAKVNANSKGSRAIFSSNSFEALGLHPYLSSLLQQGYDKGGFDTTRATAVQALTIPALKEKRNILIKSQTGSGKTLAYVLPIMHDLMTIQPPVSRSDGTLALIISPTRELCNQIADVLEKLCKVYVRLVPGSLSGGEKKKSEKARLRKGVSLLAATPGRLLDHLRTTESFVLTGLRWLVLDEVDRLFDMGFEQSVQEVVRFITGYGSYADPSYSNNSSANTLQQRWSDNRRHCRDLASLRLVMASATITAAVTRNAATILGGAFVTIDADQKKVIRSDNDGRGSSTKASKQVMTNGAAHNDGKEEDSSDDEGDDDDECKSSQQQKQSLQQQQVTMPSQLQQFVMGVAAKWKLTALLALLKLRLEPSNNNINNADNKCEKVVVFCATCDQVDYLALLLRQLPGWPRDWDEETGDEQVDKNMRNINRENINRKRKMMGSSNHDDGDEEAENTKTKKSHQATSIDPLPWRFTSPLLPSTCPVYRLHGRVPQATRRAVYKAFCGRNSGGLLLCTDVAARGLDLPEVDWILQYDPPADPADYVHRVGRTARRGRGGAALLFLLPSEAGLFLSLLQAKYGLKPEELSAQSVLQQAAAKHSPGAMRFKNSDEIAAAMLQRRIEAVVSSNRPLSLAAAQAYRSFLRAYSTRSPDAKGIFRLADLHLGHIAKSFGIKERPSHIAEQQGEGRGASLQQEGDIIGRICNGEFASKTWKESLLPKKSSNSMTNGTSKGVSKEGQESCDEDEDEDNDSDEEQEEGEEKQDDDAMETEGAEVNNRNEENEEDDEEEKQPAIIRPPSSSGDIAPPFKRRQLNYAAQKKKENYSKGGGKGNQRRRDKADHKRLRQAGTREFAAT